MYFTTTRLHQELAGGRFVDVIIDEAHDPASQHPFKGNVDLDKLQSVIDEVGAERIPYVCLATTVNMAGGQPISLANLRKVRELCNDARHPHHPRRHPRGRERLLHQAARARLRGQDASPRSSCEICSLTDGCTMSAKKDALVNIGGFLALNDWEVFEACRNLVVVYEGLHTYGGMAGRDMEAIAIGMTESVQYDHIQARVGQVSTWARSCRTAACRSCVPIGGHGVFLDAKAFLPHLDQDQFPAQALAAELYLDCGVRAMERGIVCAGRDPETGENRHPEPRARAPHHPAPRVHAGAHGRRRRVGRRGLRPARRGQGPEDGLRAQRPALLPGPLRAGR